MDAIEPKHVERFIDRLREKGRSNTTLNTYLTRLRCFSTYCVQEGYLRSDFTKGLAKPRIQKKEKAILTRAQYGKLISVIENELLLQSDRLHEGEIEWMLDMLPLAISTGMRLGELCAMRWSWVSLERQAISVLVGKDFVSKSGHERTIPVRGEGIQVLERLNGRRSNEDETTFVFTGVTDPSGRAGLDSTYVSKRFKHFVRLAKLPERISFHSLRHSFCTWLIQDGVPVPVVQKLAGHADIKTTMGYVHVAGRDLAAAVETVFGR